MLPDRNFWWSARKIQNQDIIKYLSINTTEEANEHINTVPSLMFYPQIIISVWGFFFYPWQNLTVAILSYLYLCKASRSLSALKTSQHGQVLVKQPVIFQKSVCMDEIPTHNMAVNQDQLFAFHWSKFRFIPWQLGLYFGSSGGIRFSRAVCTWT